MNDQIDAAKNVVTLVGEVIKAAGDNPQVKEAGTNLGQTAVTITKTINNALLPLAALNFGIDKAREYFSERFQQDLSARASAIPAEQVIEPKASIAGPALQGLAFTHEEPDLKEMYLSLLATSMDLRIAADAHPAFVEVIKQLTAEEARLLQGVLRAETAIPLVEVRVKHAGGEGWLYLLRHLLNELNTETSAPVENPRQAVMVDNWVRLGLVEVNYEAWLTAKEAYNWVDKRPEYIRLKAQHESAGSGSTVTFQRGILTRTAFGFQFGRAVGLL